MVCSLRHGSVQDRGNIRLLDAGEVVHHAPAQELFPGPVHLRNEAIVDVQTREVETDYLAALEESVEDLTWRVAGDTDTIRIAHDEPVYPSGEA